MRIVAFGILIFFAGLLVGKIESAPLQLKHEMQRAETGDYLVMIQNRNYVLFLISAVNEHQLVAEEITLPENSRKRVKHSWRDWVREGAPGHTSWVCYDIDLSSGQLSDYYSFSRKGWLNINEADQFLTTLLRLKFREIPPEQRRKKGRLPELGERDNRPIWHPPLIYEGRQISEVAFKAWEASWPTDGTELSDANITVYLPATKGNYPFYFPYWIEVSKNIASGKLRIVDSGKQMHSPQKRPIKTP